MDWEVLVSNAEVESALRDAANRRLVDAPLRVRTAVSAAFQRRPEITIEVGTTYAALILHDRESRRGLLQVKQRYGSITPGLFQVDLSPVEPADSGKPVHIMGRGFTIASTTPNQFADYMDYAEDPDLDPLLVLHPSSSICLANVMIGRRPTVNLSYRLPLAIIIAFGDELTRNDAGFEADSILASHIEYSISKISDPGVQFQ